MGQHMGVKIDTKKHSRFWRRLEHRSIQNQKLACTALKYKKAELPQRWRRDEFYIWVPWKISRVP